MYHIRKSNICYQSNNKLILIIECTVFIKNYTMLAAGEAI